jgi:hypothetical protein
MRGCCSPDEEEAVMPKPFKGVVNVDIRDSVRAPSVYDSVLNDADYILGDGADTRVQLGALVRAGAKFENGVLVE